MNARRYEGACQGLVDRPEDRRRAVP
jgi:hypothetical protein